MHPILLQRLSQNRLRALLWKLYYETIIHNGLQVPHRLSITHFHLDRVYRPSDTERKAELEEWCALRGVERETGCNVYIPRTFISISTGDCLALNTDIPPG